MQHIKEAFVMSSKWKVVQIVFKFYFLLKNVKYSQNLFGKDFKLKNKTKNNQDSLTVLNLISGYKQTVKKKEYQWPLDYQKRNLIFILLLVIFMYQLIYQQIVFPFWMGFIGINSVSFYVLEELSTFLLITDCILTLIYFLYQLDIQKRKPVQQRRITFIYYIIITALSAIPYLSWIFFYYFFNITILIFRILKVLQIYSFGLELIKQSKFKFFQKISLWLNTNRSQKKILLFSYQFVILVHVVTCLWFSLVQLGPINWYINYKTNQNKTHALNTAENYQISLYWTVVTFATVGYGDIVPVTNYETIFTVIWILIGMTLFSYIVGQLVSFLNKRKEKKFIASQKFFYLKQLHKQFNLKEDIIKTFTQFLEEQESTQVTQVFSQKEKQLIRTLPSQITMKLITQQYIEMYQKIECLAELDYNFLAKLTPLLAQQTVDQGVRVYEQNDHSTYIYFILQGEVAIYNKADYFVKIFKQGSYFGDIEMLKSYDRMLNALSLTKCKFLIVPKDDFLNLLNKFPKEKLYFNELAIKRDIDIKINQHFIGEMHMICFETNSKLNHWIFNICQEQFKITQDFKQDIKDRVKRSLALFKLKMATRKTIIQQQFQKVFLKQEQNKQQKQISDQQQLQESQEEGNKEEQEKTFTNILQKIQLSQQMLERIIEHIQTAQILDQNNQSK